MVNYKHNAASMFYFVHSSNSKSKKKFLRRSYEHIELIMIFLASHQLNAQNFKLYCAGLSKMNRKGLSRIDTFDFHILSQSTKWERKTIKTAHKTQQDKPTTSLQHIASTLYLVVLIQNVKGQVKTSLQQQ